jgi:hypothetical protein
LFVPYGESDVKQSQAHRASKAKKRRDFARRPEREYRTAEPLQEKRDSQSPLVAGLFASCSQPLFLKKGGD